VRNSGVHRSHRWVGHVFPYNQIARFDYFQNYLLAGTTAGPFRIVMGAVPCSYVVRYYIAGLPEWISKRPSLSRRRFPSDAGQKLGELKARYR